MESEKVKEIKLALEGSIKMGERMKQDLYLGPVKVSEILEYINELESENEELLEEIKSLKGRWEMQFKRIVELKKENKSSYDSYHKGYKVGYEYGKQDAVSSDRAESVKKELIKRIVELERENERLLESCKNCHYIKDLEIANGHAKEIKDRITELEDGIAKSMLGCEFLPECSNEKLKQFVERIVEKLKENVNGENVDQFVDFKILLSETLNEFIE